MKSNLMVSHGNITHPANQKCKYCERVKKEMEKEYVKLFGPDMNNWPSPICSSAKRIYECIKARVQKRFKGKDNKRTNR